MLRRYLYHVKNRTGVCEITILATYEQAQTTSLTAASVSDPGMARTVKGFPVKVQACCHHSHH